MAARAAGRSASLLLRPVFLIALTAVVILAMLGWCGSSITAACGAPLPWDCGFGRLNARMQDTAEGFGQPIRHIFGPFFAVKRELPSPFDAHRAIASWSVIGSGNACMCRSARSCNASRIPSHGCSRDASPLTCSTASSRSWSCWRSCYESRSRYSLRLWS